MSGGQNRKGASIKSTSLDFIKGGRQVLSLFSTTCVSFMVIFVGLRVSGSDLLRKVKVSTYRLLQQRA